MLDLAAGSLGQLGVAQAAEAVVGTLNAYGLAADKAAGVTDKLLRITQLTNFQTRDFEAGLSKAAATGAVFSQNLDDVLITMGLLRNRNIDASSSATAFRESVRRVGAESRAQQAITSAGVKVFDDQSGRMRSIVDIMSDFAQATSTMSDEERNRRVVTAFGARGLLAFNAVLNASFTTMRDGQQVTLRGAEAIAALRDQMTDAGGTAARFREQLLDTFEGQKTLLKGTLQTFAVVLGEPFAAVFKPIVRAVVDTLNAILRAFQSVPAPIKRIFAGHRARGRQLPHAGRRGHRSEGRHRAAGHRVQGAGHHRRRHPGHAASGDPDRRRARRGRGRASWSRSSATSAASRTSSGASASG